MKLSAFKTLFLKEFHLYSSEIEICLRTLYSAAKADARTTTGSNLRNILLLTNLSNIDDIQPGCMENIKYHQILESKKWRISLIKEAIDIKSGNTIMPEVPKMGKGTNFGSFRIISRSGGLGSFLGLLR